MLQVQLSIEQQGLNGSAVYLCTEDVPLKRLKQIADGFISRYKLINNEEMNPCDRIYIERINSIENLCDSLCNRLPIMMEQRKVRLIVIDSIAALIRPEFDGQENVDKAQFLFALGGRLQQLSNTFTCPILVINQVSDVFHDGRSLPLQSWSTSGRKVIPALGLSWSNCVNTRIVLARTGGTRDALNLETKMNDVGNKDSISSTGTPPTILRELRVAFSPYLSTTSSCSFMIDDTGVHGIPTHST
jgi:DNA-repair protein XRCC3